MAIDSPARIAPRQTIRFAPTRTSGSKPSTGLRRPRLAGVRRRGIRSCFVAYPVTGAPLLLRLLADLDQQSRPRVPAAFDPPGRSWTRKPS